MKKSRQGVFKWIWLLIVFGGVVFYLTNNIKLVIELIKDISILSIVFSILFLVIGKLLITVSSLWAIAGQDWKPPYKKMLHINSVTQLAKYLPGGVWHYFGKLGAYKNNGLTTKQSSKSILLENLWLIISAFCFGLMLNFIWHENFDFTKQAIQNYPFSRELSAILILIVWIIAFWLIDKIGQLKSTNSLLKISKLMLLQGSAWMFFGLSFWVLLPKNLNLETVFSAIGSFAVGWATGFVTVFAPGGLGVREIALSALLKNQYSLEQAALFSGLHRIVWVITELGLGIFTEIRFGLLDGKTMLKRKNNETANNSTKTNNQI